MTVNAILMVASLALTPKTVEVVVAPDAPRTVRFAAQEATNFLSRVFGSPVAVATAPTEGRASLVLGDNGWSRAVGIDVAKLPRDGFAIRTAGSRIFVAGRDDAKADPVADIRNGAHGNLMYERATLFGVYEFLERFADCRFFFPGECGEIAPRREVIEVPETNLVWAPHFTSRDPYFGGDGAWYEDEGFGNQRGRSCGKVLSWLRLRMDTEHVPCCHGQRWNMIRERFSESHPEYFQMSKDGTRCTGYPKPGEAEWNFNQLCQSSGIWDVFYEDAKAYFSGKDAASRGIPSRWNRKKFAWNGNFSGRYVDVMCQDAFHECFCPACQKAYDKSSKHYARDLVWGQTAKLAQRLKDDGFDAVVSQMSYPPYGEIPSFDLPDNVLVTVAQQGPWGIRNRAGFEGQLAMYRGWFEKTKRRVRTWTYAHKYGKTNIPGIPCVAPRAYGEYWKTAAPYVCGGFLETESERSIHHYFNYYVFSKIAWDPKMDVEALIADHHEKMFGKGAAAMAEFYGLLEDTWIGKIAGNVKDTIYGPQAVVPSEYDIWTKVYSPAFISKLAALCDRATEAVGADTSEAKRIAFIRRHCLEPLKESAAAYRKAISVERGLKERAGRPNRTLLKNGDFDEGLKDWEVCEGGEVAFDETTKVTGRGSVRLTSTERAEVKQYLNADFKPGKKYRITFFIKTKDIRPVKGEKGGVYVEFYDGWWQFFPKSDYRGTMDWMYQEWTMTSSQAKPGDKLFIHLLMNGVSGTAWFDDIRVEPVEEW